MDNYDQYSVNMQIGISDLEGTQQRITGNQNTLKKDINKKIDFQEKLVSSMK